MRSYKFLILFFLFITFIFAVHPASKSPFIKAPNQSPSFLLFPSPHHLSANFNAREELSLDILLTYSGHYWGEHYDRHKIDQLMEMGGLYIDTAWRLKENMIVGLEIPVFYRTENTFRHISHRGMKDFYRDRVILDNKQLYNNAIQEVTTGDINVYSFYEIFDKKKILFSAKIFGLIEIPTGEQSDGHSNGNTDYGLGISLNRNFGSNLRTNLKITHLAPGELEGFNRRETKRYTALTANLDYRIDTNWEGLFQASYNNSPFENLPMRKLASDTLFFTIAINYSTDHHTYQIGFTEDLLESSVATPDYALNLRYLHRFSF